MIIPILVFSLAAVIMSGVLVAVAFHVTRYRYENDASLFVFITITILYILMTILIFVFFEYQAPTAVDLNPLIRRNL